MQFGWPLGLPLVDFLGHGLWEVRTRLPNLIARTIFLVDGETTVLLHGFIKKIRTTPPTTNSQPPANESTLMSIPKNRHRGSTLASFLRKEGLYEEVEAVALKKVISLALARQMNRRRISVSALAKKLGTSRAAVNRMLDEENTSLTLNTLSRAASAVGCEVRLEIFPAA